MKAIAHDVYGPPEHLRMVESAEPPVGDDQVLLRVRAAGLNPADWAIASGLPYPLRLGFGLRKPRKPALGTDLAGTVVSVGKNVKTLRPGDAVMGEGIGSFAELALAKPTKLVTKPSGLSFEEAAGAPMAGLVALQALRDQAELESGQRILINGASGGIGTFAVQIAKTMGADVTGVCSGANRELVESLGADRVIDYAREDFTKGSERFDVILDNVGKHSLAELRGVLSDRGTLVPNSGNFENKWIASTGRIAKAKMWSPFLRQNLRPFLSTVNSVDLDALTALMAGGQVRTVIDRVYPLAEAGAALAYVGEGHARGKVVIAP